MRWMRTNLVVCPSDPPAEVDVVRPEHLRDEVPESGGALAEPDPLAVDSGAIDAVFDDDLYEPSNLPSDVEADHYRSLAEVEFQVPAESLLVEVPDDVGLSDPPVEVLTRPRLCGKQPPPPGSFYAQLPDRSGPTLNA